MTSSRSRNLHLYIRCGYKVDYKTLRVIIQTPRLLSELFEAARVLHPYEPNHKRFALGLCYIRRTSGCNAIDIDSIVHTS